MVVALRALDGDRAESIHGGGDHVIAVEMTRDLAIAFRFGDFGVTDEIPWPGCDEPGGDHTIWRGRPEDIARNLFLHKLCVGFILIEGPDDIVTVGPGIQAELVLVVSMGLAEVDHIEPMTCPTFAITRRVQELLHQFLVGIGIWIVDEFFDLIGCGGKPDNIEIKPSDEHAAVGFGR